VKLEVSNSSSPNAHPSATRRLGQAIVVGVSLATATLPAHGQERPVVPTLGTKDLEPVVPRTAVSDVPQTNVSKIEVSAVGGGSSVTSQPELPIQTRLLTILATACSIGAMGWYYLQLRRRETTGSVTTSGLCAANNALLSGTALLTGQGIGPAVMMAGFAAVGMLCAHVLRKQNPGPLEFSTLDKVCVAGCVAGWATLGAGFVPGASTMVTPENLAMVGSMAGTAVNSIACLPIMRLLMARPSAEELRPEARIKSPIRPVLPYLVSTAAMTLGLLSVTNLTWRSGIQPAVLLGQTLVLTGMATLWALRRRAVDDVTPSVRS
jgi:hypothetical protein